jgi:hypothetical protein
VVSSHVRGNKHATHTTREHIPLDPTDASDDAAGGDMVLVEAVTGQLRQLEEGRPGSRGEQRFSGTKTKKRGGAYEGSRRRRILSRGSSLPLDT